MVDISWSYANISQHLAGIHAFVIVTRCGNFTAGAQMLGMSQSAISQRIRTLELELGVKLFNREHRGVSLTNDGLRLVNIVEPAISDIEKALTGLLEGKSKPRVRISVDFAFSTFWLLPRLGFLRAALGDQIEVQVLASQEPLALEGDDCDISIHVSPFEIMRDRDVLLFQESVFPVCSPKYLEQYGPFDRSEQLLDGPLLSLLRPPSAEWQTWEGWFHALGITSGSDHNYISFNNYDMVVQAAVDGQGVALGWSGLVDDAIKRGSLVSATGDIVASNAGYIMSRDYAAASNGPELVFDWIAANISNHDLL